MSKNRSIPIYDCAETLKLHVASPGHGAVAGASRGTPANFQKESGLPEPQEG